MKLTRKYGGRKYSKHTRKIRARRTKRARKSKVKRGGSGWGRAYSAQANFAVEGVGGNVKSLPLRYNGGRKSRVKRGGAGITSSSIYSHATKPAAAFKSLPAEFPVSTTIKELGGYFPFEKLGIKY